MTPLRLLLVSASLLSLCAARASAQEREFTLSRDWFLPGVGEHELELRSRFDTRHGEFFGELEYEHGLTDWFTIEPEFEFQKVGDEDLEADSAALVLRFHALDFAPDKLLPALNAEFEFPFHADDDMYSELQFVLSRYGSSGNDMTLNFSAGQTLEGPLVRHDELTLGFLHNFGGKLHTGEDWGEDKGLGLEFSEEFQDHLMKLGPVFKLRASHGVNLVASYVVGLNERDANSDLLSLILEYEF